MKLNESINSLILLKFLLSKFYFRRSESIRDARYDDERMAYEREYLKKVDHRDSV
jgi:hypothetical protein